MFERCVCCKSQAELRDERYTCLDCGSVMIPKRRSFHYESEYPEQRFHFDRTVRKNKMKTISDWVKTLGFDLRSKNVFEFGFGSGPGIEYFQSLGAKVNGVELVKANHSFLVAQGIEVKSLATSLEELKEPTGRFDFSFYFDSFEHILEPEQHLQKLNRFVAKEGQCLVVLPRADSLSRKLLGGLWPHDLPDHWIFYSRQGLISLFERNGWKYTMDFNPTKRISLQMVVDHFCLKMSFKKPPSLPFDVSFNFNIGEIAMLFKKVDHGQI